MHQKVNSNSGGLLSFSKMKIGSGLKKSTEDSSSSPLSSRNAVFTSVAGTNNHFVDDERNMFMRNVNFGSIKKAARTMINGSNESLSTCQDNVVVSSSFANSSAATRKFGVKLPTRVSSESIRTYRDSASSLESCLSNHHPNSRRRSNNKTKQRNVSGKKGVHFNDDTCQWKFVESYVPYASDLWWSKEEFQQRKRDMSRLLQDYSPDELKQIREYSYAYHNARQRSFVSKSSSLNDSSHHEATTSTSSTAKKSKVNISNEDYRLIVQGKVQGWDGLERMYDFTQYIVLTTQKDNVLLTRQAIAKTIVTKYQQLRMNQLRMEALQVNSLKYDIEKQIRQISTSLTSNDRSWALIMGNSDQEALARS